MKFQFQIKSEWVLGGVALLLISCVLGLYFWGIGAVVSGFGQAFNVSPAPDSSAQFNSGTAQKILEKRGIQP